MCEALNIRRISAHTRLAKFSLAQILTDLGIPHQCSLPGSDTDPRMMPSFR